jgi:hypothetical protein
LPTVSSNNGSGNISPYESNLDLVNQNSQNNNNNNNQLNHASCNMSSSSSTTSSNVPSPALTNTTNNNNTTTTQEDNNSSQQQNAWPSSASKMARVANKIVQSINYVSTPKQSHKQLQPVNDIKNLSESRSDSSCGSSGPNSPNYYKNQAATSATKLTTTQNNNNNNDKKSTSSSSSVSSSQLTGPCSIKAGLQMLTPIQSTSNSTSSSQSTNTSSSKYLEFFPPLNSPTPKITKTDIESNYVIPNNPSIDSLNDTKYTSSGFC